MKRILVSSVLAIGVMVLGLSQEPVVTWWDEACTEVESRSGGPFNVGASLKGSYRVSGVTSKGDCARSTTYARFTNKTGFGCQSGTYYASGPERCQNLTSGASTAATAKWDAPCNSGNVQGTTVHGGSPNSSGDTWYWHSPAAITLGTQCAPPPPPPIPEPEGYCEYYGDWDPENEVYVCSSPIIIAVGSRDPYKMTTATDGVLFDLDNDGDLDQVAWTARSSDTAFLAIDRNNNGSIDSGHELWGDSTLPNQPHGFAALWQWSFLTRGTREGWIDTNDRIYERLLLWVDKNHNGLSEQSELKKFKNHFEAVSLTWEVINRQDGLGNNFAIKGWVKPYQGDLLTVYDVFLSSLTLQ